MVLPDHESPSMLVGIASMLRLEGVKGNGNQQRVLPTKGHEDAVL